MKTRVKTAAEIELMRQAGKVVALVLNEVAAAVRPGVSTKELAQLAASRSKSLGARPAFMGYLGFPDVICVSINDQVVHGVPGGRKVRTGDIVGLDFGASVGGMIADGATTVAVGQVDADTERLLEGTRRALESGLAVVRAGARMGDISAAIGKTLIEHNLTVIDALTGHGVGHRVHEDPNIPNHGRAGTGMELKAGMTLAIEPMASLGSPEIGLALDRRTIITLDGTWAAQFEHTVLVGEGSCEILTTA